LPNNKASLHDKGHVLDGADIVEWVARDGYNIR
jgi:hypothetical protein